MNIVIRPAYIQDATSLAELIRGLGLFHHIEEESPEATAARVERHLALCLSDDSHSIYVAAQKPDRFPQVYGQASKTILEDISATPVPDENLSGFVIVGYVAVHWLPYLILAGPEGYVSELFIAESARGQSIGAQLLDAAEQAARQRGCSRLMLLNMRNRESYQRGFYAKHGWEERTQAANFVRKLT